MLHQAEVAQLAARNAHELGRHAAADRLRGRRAARERPPRAAAPDRRGVARRGLARDGPALQLIQAVRDRTARRRRRQPAGPDARACASRTLGSSAAGGRRCRPADARGLEAAHARAARPRAAGHAAARREPGPARRGPRRSAATPGCRRRSSRRAEPRVEAVLLSVAASGGAALLPAAITQRYAAPGVRLVELAGSEPAFETAVLTQPDRTILQSRLPARRHARRAARGVAAPPRLQAPPDVRRRGRVSLWRTPRSRSLLLLGIVGASARRGVARRARVHGPALVPRARPGGRCSGRR